ncbi:FecCD family ABC transporter permease [Desulfosoma caldarium]|uniref:Iron complex transport system permease protein n=1 Tax=Desulfosoma caldarium TaxID=610254 RepID=A0A3N1UPX2_9BACT|nr:iron ABC transporter permease [Desulfosoma caldarium]ROQ93185.1 iron complex transport system permease protein [Desulfosoma caldarium]
MAVSNRLETPMGIVTPARLVAVTLMCAAGLLGAIVFGMAVGSSGTDFTAVFRSLQGKKALEATQWTILWRLRWPRVLMAMETGAALALGGLVFQALLRNPLAEPYILGTSGGAAVGAILGILMGLSPFPGVGAAAFASSALSLALVVLLASGRAGLRREALLLSGVMVNAFCGALILFFVSTTQDARLHTILFWLMGDLSRADMAVVWRLGAVLAVCAVILFAMARPMNVMLMGRDVAKSLGVSVTWMRLFLLGVTTVMVSAAVCATGLLGFVGLAVPHGLRLLFGPDHRVLVPACFLGGGAYLIGCDALARWIPQHGEMPAGVVTALIGAPLFIVLLRRATR